MWIADRSLLSVWRDDLILPALKTRLHEGSAAACTALVEGWREILPHQGGRGGRQANRHHRGTGAEGALHPNAEAFLDADAMQCATAVPG